MDYFGSLVLGLMLAGSAAPAWVGALGALAIVASIAILTWQARGWWERRRDVEFEPELLPPSMTERPALFEVTAVRDRSQPPVRRQPSPGPRSRLVVHEEPVATVAIPTVYGSDPDATAELTLREQPRRHRR